MAAHLPRTSRRSLVGVLLAAVLVAGCQPSLESRSGPFTIGSISADAGDRHTTSEPGRDALTVQASTRNRGGNTRMAIVRDGSPLSVDQAACVTWNGPDVSAVQPGVVLRTRTSAGRTRAIMVTNNVWGDLRWVVNVHTVDTDRSPAYTKVGAFTTTRLGVSKRTPLPWRFCAEVAGRQLRAKAWSTALPEPVWGDPDGTFTMTLPADQVVAGRPGVYAGHLQAGQVARFTGRTTTDLTGRAPTVAPVTAGSP